MTKQEFTQRTGVEVSNIEFDAIHMVYMNSDLDKDEFCKMWCKMNSLRVQSAKVDKILAARDEAYRDALHKFYNKTIYIDFNTPIILIDITVYEIQAMSYAGIMLENEAGSGRKTILDIRYEIGKFLRMY